MTLVETLDQSSKLLDDFESTINSTKNNQKIIDLVEKISIDLKKYESKDLLNNDDIQSESKKEIIKTKIQEIIHKIDKLNLIVVPKSNLGKNFSEFNELK